jgi:hypothetical protein
MIKIRTTGGGKREEFEVQDTLTENVNAIPTSKAVADYVAENAGSGGSGSSALVYSANILINWGFGGEIESISTNVLENTIGTVTPAISSSTVVVTCSGKTLTNANTNVLHGGSLISTMSGICLAFASIVAGGVVRISVHNLGTNSVPQFEQTRVTIKIEYYGS